MAVTRRRIEGTPIHISGMKVGSFVAFVLPRLDNGCVFQDNHAGEIATYEEDRTGMMPKIRFTLKDNPREFVLRFDYEVRIP